MRSVRITYAPVVDAAPEDLANVSALYVTGAGALAVELEHGNRPGTLRGVLVAPGDWIRAEDWNTADVPDDPEQLAEQLAEPAPAPVALAQREPEPARHRSHAHNRGPVLVDQPTDPAGPRFPFVPTGVEPLGIVRDPLQMSDARRLRDAMTVYCVCASLRCPTMVQTEPEPLQCDQLDQHPGGCTNLGRWTFGPGNHHPRCPRHPGNYNRNASVCGRLVEIDGFPMIGTGCLLPADHTGAHDYATPGTEGQPAQPAGLTVPALRTQRERAAAGHAVRGELVGAGVRSGSGAWPVVADPAPEQIGDMLTGLVQPGPLRIDDVLRAHASDDWFRARTLGDACGAPEPTGLELVCQRPTGHDYGPHAATEPGSGDLLQW